MTEQELQQNINIWANEYCVDPNFVEPIPKAELEIGRTYCGNCRNADQAVWNGKTFTYKRYKFGSTYDEDINHYEDDDGYDVFVPVRIIRIDEEKKRCMDDPKYFINKYCKVQVKTYDGLIKEVPINIK
jgi:hypothetical protein